MAEILVSVENLRGQLGREVFVLSREVLVLAVVAYLVDLVAGLARVVVESLTGVVVGQVELPQVSLALNHHLNHSQRPTKLRVV